MAKTNAPNSYKDPYWSSLASSVEKKLELPSGLLKSILLYGERSNADQVSEAGAKTPFQIIPSTRNAVLEKYGVDAYLSPENSAEAAGLLLKESLDRNKGDIKLAAAEYHGGTNPKNWGPRTKSYIERVTAATANQQAPQQSTFQRVMASRSPAGMAPASIQNIYNAYASNKMTPEEAADFETDVKSGAIMLPRGASLIGQKQPATELMELPPAVVNAYNTGKMTREEMMELESDVRNGAVRAPAGLQIKETEPLGFFGGIREAVTGSERRTATTEALPEWVDMPEVNAYSMAGFKSALGTLMTNPDETVQVIQANYPGVKVTQDEKGNYVMQSSIDGKLYAIKPGFRASDIPRTAATLAAFTPAGRAKTLAGMALGAGTTQAAIETSQAATGGEFDAGEVATTAALAPILPAAVRGVQAVRAARAPAAAEAPEAAVRAAARPAPAPTVAAEAPEAAARVPVAPAVAEVPEAAARVQVAAAEVPEAAARTRVAPPVAAMAPEELATTARTAAEGGFGATRATAVLAGQAAPDPKVIEAARRIGVDEYLQPDHLTANQAYRELAQAVKSIPGSQTRAAEIKGLEQVGLRADRLISEIGGTTDLSRLNQAVRSQLDSTITSLGKNADDVFTSMRNSIPAQTRGQANNVLNFVQKRSDDLDGAENLSSLEKMVRSKLTPKPILDDAGNVTGTRAPTYALIDDVRRDVGAAARQQGPFADADTGLAKQLYRLISDDQQALAKTAGQGDNYMLANSLVRMRKGLEDDMVSLFGKQLDQSLVSKLESATMALSKGDAEKLAKILNAIPKDMRQMVTASALNTAFGKATQNGVLNFNSYSKWYEGLLANKQAYAALMTNLPQSARKQLSDLYRVSSNIAKATRERITTGRIQSVQQEIQGSDTLMSNIYGVAKRAAVGLPIEAGTTAIGLPGAGIASGIASALTKGKPNALKAADELISSPEFQRLTVDAVSTGNQPSKASINAVLMSQSFKKFAKEVRLPREMSAQEKFIVQSLQAEKQFDQENQ